MSTLWHRLEQGWRALTHQLSAKHRAERHLLEALSRDYQEELQLAAALEKESEHIPYSHLRKKLLEIADREKEHATRLQEKIRELGGQIPAHAAELQAKRDGQQWTTTLDLLKILEEEKQEYAEYLERRKLAKAAEREDILQLLDQIREEEAAHRRELMDILVRLNPLPRT